MPFVFTLQVAVKLIERSVDKITKNVSIQTLLILACRAVQMHKKASSHTATDNATHA